MMSELAIMLAFLHLTNNTEFKFQSNSNTFPNNNNYKCCCHPDQSDARDSLWEEEGEEREEGKREGEDEREEDAEDS